VTDALKRSATPSDEMLYFWKKAQSLGATVKKRDLKDLLYYCFDYGRSDSVTIQKAVETACELEKAKYWNSMLFEIRQNTVILILLKIKKCNIHLNLDSSRTIRPPEVMPMRLVCSHMLCPHIRTRWTSFQ
jgi:hypothetical protein